MVMKVSDWSGEDVARWLCQEGLQEYCGPLRSLDGQALLALGPSDLVSRVTSDGGQRLLERVQTLRGEPAGSNGVAPKHKTKPAQRNGVRNGQPIANGEPVANGNGFGPDRPHGDAWIQIPLPVPGAADLAPSYASSLLPEEWGRTGVALLYAAACFVLTSVMISVVHERVPPKESTPPLPDKFFDWFDRKEWAFMVCEVIGLFLLAVWLILWAFHKHRSIVGRRFFFIMGTLYLYRCVTMYLTTLPVPGMHFHCAPKVMGDHMSQARRVFKMIAGGGLTITGSHHMCGDYLYSGHTVLLTLSYLFITEYSPRRLWWYHWLCGLLCAVALFCILLAHDHYSIDVVVAYYVTTQLFWLYHTMANQQVLKESSTTNFMCRVWWFRFFLYLEANVQSSVPRHYLRPALLRRLLPRRQVRYSRLADSECP